MRGIGTGTIETKRLTLRKFRRADAPQVYRNWAGDPEVSRRLSWHAHEDEGVTAEIVEGWERGYRHPYRFNWAVVLRESGEVAGCISLLGVNVREGSAEAGYCIGRAFWGQGIATEALKGVLGYCFERARFALVYAKHDVNNPASGRVLQKCGMELTGRGTGRLEAKGLDFTYDLYGITCRQWSRQRRALAENAFSDQTTT